MLKGSLNKKAKQNFHALFLIANYFTNTHAESNMQSAHTYFLHFLIKFTAVISGLQDEKKTIYNAVFQHNREKKYQKKLQYMQQNCRLNMQ